MSDQDDLVPGLVPVPPRRSVQVGMIGLVICGLGISIALVGLIVVGISGGAQQDAITALSTIGGALAGGISGWLIRGRLPLEDEQGH